MSALPRRTQVAIVGGGPAGLLLAHILGRAGIDSVVLERASRAHVLSRIRAGVLEAGTVRLLREHGLGARLDAEGAPHDDIGIVWAGGRRMAVDIGRHTGRTLVAFGQTAITEALYAASDAAGRVVVERARDVALHDVDSAAPSLTWHDDDGPHRLEADWIAGCDGYHGVSRRSIPPGRLRTFEKTYPFGWLGILSRTPPLEQIVYANHPRGFAMCSQRGAAMSRYYVQCPLEDTVGDWPDERFWAELATRMGPAIGAEIATGPSIEKSIAPLRSFVAEPMRHGRLCLAGDAAHIVPPTGAKGLNLAVSDVHYLSEALIARYRDGTDAAIDAYSETALRRVWGAMRFSWQMTMLLHRFPDQSDIDQRLQESELEHLAASAAAQQALAEQYVGLPF